MTAIRRILILVVGLALLVDGAALAYIKINSGPTPSEEKSKLVIWIDDPAKAKAVGELLKTQGYEPIVKPDKRKTEVEADFRVAMNGEEKILKSIAQILKQSKKNQVSFNEDRTKLYYGGFYKQKAEAMRVAKRIKAEEQLVFDVVPGTKVVAKNSTKVVLVEVPSNLVDGILAEVATKATIADSSETSLEPKEDAAAEGSSESESSGSEEE